jgi:hypothetical protein
MAISVIDVQTAAGNSYIGNPESLSVAKPSGQNDDLMIAVFGGFPITWSRSGWSTIAQVTYTDHIDRRVQVMAKRMTDYAGEPSSWAFSSSSYPVTRVVVFSLRGVYFSDPGYQIVSVGNDYNVTRTITGVTTTNDNAFVLSIPHWVQYAPVDGLSDEGITHWTSDTGAVTDIYVGEGHEAEQAAGVYFTGTTYFTGFAVGYNVNATAGLNISTVWTRYGGGGGPVAGGGVYGGNSMGIQLAINSQGSGGGGTCTCNAICDNDCGANQICTGNAPACLNSYTFTSISVGTIVRASHLRELETAINQERGDSGRRYYAADPTYCLTHIDGDVACPNNTFGQWSFFGGDVGDVIEAADFNNIALANNEVVYGSGYGTLITKFYTRQQDDPTDASVIFSGGINDLQTKINETRNACICDSHCNCDPSDCGCNGECPSDDYYYYV